MCVRTTCVSVCLCALCVSCADAGGGCAEQLKRSNNANEWDLFLIKIRFLFYLAATSRIL